jgi:hypothetical protein
LNPSRTSRNQHGAMKSGGFHCLAVLSGNFPSWPKAFPSPPLHGYLHTLGRGKMFFKARPSGASRRRTDTGVEAHCMRPPRRFSNLSRGFKARAARRGGPLWPPTMRPSGRPQGRAGTGAGRHRGGQAQGRAGTRAGRHRGLPLQ